MMKKMMMMVSYFPLVGFFVSCNVELRLVGVKEEKGGVCSIELKGLCYILLYLKWYLILHSYGCWWPVGSLQIAVV